MKSSYSFDFGSIVGSIPFLLKGLSETVQVTIMSLLMGLVVGLLVGLWRTSRGRLLQWTAGAYIEVFRNTPALVQLMWVYYCLPILSGWTLSAKTSVILALGLNASAYVAEIVRAGIQSIDVGQFEAARCLGLSRRRTMYDVILPQALRRMQPALVNEAIALLKFSSLVSVLGVADLTYQANVLATTTFRPIEVFTIIAVIYFILCYALSFLAQRLEGRRAFTQ